MDMLHPKLFVPMGALIRTTRAFVFELPGGREGRFEPFEGYRHPKRQLDLLTRTKSTKSGPWESAHQYGLAVDFAVRVRDVNPAAGVTFTQWVWENEVPWGTLKILASREGLTVPIEWDKGHVAHPLAASFLKFA